MRKSIHDLRAHHNDFTIEHCSVLLERLSNCLDTIYGEGFRKIADQVNATSMHEDLLTIMTSQQLCLLFDSELGKGLIIGIFFDRFILNQHLDAESEE